MAVKETEENLEGFLLLQVGLGSIVDVAKVGTWVGFADGKRVGAWVGVIVDGVLESCDVEQTKVGLVEGNNDEGLKFGSAKPVG